tara:strand:- start:39574 stop:39924 length:351 start_codon:yes stop_codon:yes gene_type:complete
MELFEIAGEQFYFDLDCIADFVRIDENEPKNLEDLLKKDPKVSKENDIINENELISGPLIDMTRWDLTKAMVETILSENNGIIDERMGVTKLGEQLSIPFRLSFNTLVRHKLIKIR